MDRAVILYLLGIFVLVAFLCANMYMLLFFRSKVHDVRKEIRDLNLELVAATRLSSELDVIVALEEEPTRLKGLANKYLKEGFTSASQLINLN